MEFCEGPFWDWNLTWENTTNPNFTQCFQDTVLIWIPCSAFFICALGEILLSRQRGLRLPWTALLIAKFSICVALLGVQIVYLWDLIHLPMGYTRAQYWSAVIQLFTIIAVVAYMLHNKLKGAITSMSLLIFWLTYTVATGVRFRSVLLGIFEKDTKFEVPSLMQYLLTTFTFPLVVAQLVLNCFADRRLSFYVGRISAAKTCPENECSFLSALWFWWFNDMVSLGYKRIKQNSGIHLGDMWALDENNRSEGVIKKFLPLYGKEVAKKQNRPTNKTNNDGSPVLENRLNIIFPLFRTFRWNLVGISVIKLVASLLTFVSPIILNKIITFVQSDEPMWKGVFLASIMLFSSMAESILNSQYEYRVFRIAMRLRSALTYAIYCKSLKMSSQAKNEFTTGEIVTLMSVDSQRIVDQVNVMNMLWAVPLQITIALIMLWQQLGIATLGGVLVMILLIPINSVCTAYLRRQQVQLMRHKDKRTKLMTEILNGIRILKLYAWEKSFIRRITNMRGVELASLRAQAWSSGFMVLAFTSAPFLVAMASFSFYVLSDPNNVLDANKAFVSLSLFNILKLPMAFLPMLIMFTAMFCVSMNRINRFLRSEELDEDSVTKIRGSDTAIRIENGCFQYARDDPKPVLKNINMEVKKGMLIAIVGVVGTGKSTLLNALLGDLVKKSGKVTVSGSVAYVPQQAWIQGTSIKNNILFGSKYDRARYEQVIDVCALRADLAILPGKDETEVGQNGINLSGGQKQRISLARAVYSGSDVYYFDDPLSAVDSHVSKHIFDHLISNKGILASKTRVLVTHRLSVLDQCDLVYVLKNGMISEWGTYRQLVARKGAFADFLVQHLQEKANTDEIPEEDLKVMEDIIKEGAATPELARHLSFAGGEESDSLSGSSVRSRKSRLSKVDLKEQKTETVPLGTALTKDEESAVGAVKWKVFREYLVAMGAAGSVITLIAFVMTSGFNMLASIWLSKWSEDSSDPAVRNSTAQRDYRLGVYAAWGTGETLAALVASISLNLITLQGGRVLHERMLDRVLHAPMSFFDTTPMGRILNRFSKDIDTADVTIRFSLRMVIQQFFRTAASLLLIAMQTPVFLILVLPLAIMYYFVQKYYIATSRHLKRLDSTSRSPVYVHFSETLTGCASIRAYGAEQRFIEISNLRTDVSHSAYYPSLAASRWLSLRLEFLGYTIVFLATLLAALARDTLSPGYAALSVAASLTVTQTLNMLVKFSSEVEANFVSVERCLEYAEVESEADWVVESNRPDPTWPAGGAIDFSNYSTRYREGLPLVVQNINIQIQPGEKVAVVGRTGAGKSSLALALFRLIEAADGNITIDSLDISRIGLHDLRSKLTIIPQDPVLFSGTLRENLDPFEEKSDEEVWKAIEQAHLKDFVNEWKAGLTYEINEGGENLSVGQRQLVCLARALLRRSKILMLDEATAAVDMETDRLIQETLRKEFKDSTTLATAHRLNTIMDYDKVLVMREGRVVDFDTTKSLMENPNSVFYSMAKDAGLV